jgi:D-sedoheptulose 7-phosphate isomerase
MNNPFSEYIEALQGAHLETEFKKFQDAFSKTVDIIILGNGGSNAVASHISQDYVKFHGKRSMVFSDPSMLTCYINDFGMENAYVKFLEAYANQDTLIILISSGGESQNILNCIEWCEKTHKKYGILTGFEKNNSARKLSKNSIWSYHIPSESYGIVECVHQIFLHGVV